MPPVFTADDSASLGLPGKHQIINASLAVAICKTLTAHPSLPTELSPLKEYSTTSNPLLQTFLPYLKSARWPGRCQTVVDPSSSSPSRKGKGKTTWYLDGAHTVESLTCCSEWVFAPNTMGLKKKAAGIKRVLIFNCTSERSAPALLKALLTRGKEGSASELGETFDHVVFCANVTYIDGGFKGGELFGTAGSGNLRVFTFRWMKQTSVPRPSTQTISQL